jgi:hypothetical protein
MEAICFPKKSVDFQRTAWPYMPEDSALQESTCFPSWSWFQEAGEWISGDIFRTVALCRVQSILMEFAE